MTRTIPIAFFPVALSAALVFPIACRTQDVSLTLPAGFRSQLFADNVGIARHMAVAPSGIVYVSLEDRNHASAGTSHIDRELGRGGVLALRDTNGDGRADTQTRLFENTEGGTGIALRGDTLYYSTIRSLLRYRLAPNGLSVVADPDTILRGMPAGGHSSRAFALDDSGNVYINVGSESNVCNATKAAAPDPCVERSSRAGIWRYRTDRLRQSHPNEGEHFGVGIRNAVGIAWHPQHRALYATSHGRDALHQRFGEIYSADQGAEKPSEELMRVQRGDDFGWPYCFHDAQLRAKVLAPEYGGDGRATGRCSTMKLPLIGFPGHWAPNDLMFYTGESFPAKYHGGAFIAFHGSWNRAPRQQAGYKVVFVPFANGAPTGAYETFADGFAAGTLDPGGARHRPTGLAMLPDGSMLISDDQRGRIWRVTYSR
jgi:glucose/arabinose dehydrogenase